MVPVAYNLRSLAVRRATTAATALGIALVVFVLSSALMLSAGIRQTLASTGSHDIALILSKGADSELASGIESVQAGLILAQPEVRTDPQGAPDGVAEAVVVLSLEKSSGSGASNVTVRGVSPAGLAFRPELRVVAGRAPRPGADECLVGKAIEGRFRGLRVGEALELRPGRVLRVVGVSASGGSAYESEIWADLDIVREAFGREGYVQSIRARLTGPARFASLERALESNPQLAVEVEREDRFYERQSEGTATLIAGLGTTIAVMFALGATIGAMITMYSAVAHRRREIGCLRALGFGKLSIMMSFLFEAVALSCLGGAIGALCASAMRFVHFSVINLQTFSEIVFRFEPTAASLGGGGLLALAMGVAGGLLPALRAAMMPLISTLKD